MRLSCAPVKRWNHNPSLSAQNPPSTPGLRGNGVTAREESDGFSLALDKCFHELSHFVLLVTRKVAGFIKNFPQLARRSLPAWFAGIASHQKISGDAQDIGERGQLLGTQGHRLSFPVRNYALARSQFFGELKLG